MMMNKPPAVTNHAVAEVTPRPGNGCQRMADHCALDADALTSTGLNRRKTGIGPSGLAVLRFVENENTTAQMENSRLLLIGTRPQLPECIRHFGGDPGELLAL